MAERQEQDARDAARQLESTVRDALTTMAELGTAQQGYVATGQSHQFWIDQIDALLPRLRARFETIAGAAQPPVRAAIDHAAALTNDFEAVDQRAREYVRVGQASAASSIIYSDGLDAIQRMTAALQQAREEAARAGDADVAAMQRREQFSLGAAGAAALLVALLLLPTGTRAEHADADTVSFARLRQPPVVEAPPQIDEHALLLNGEEGWTPAARAAQGTEEAVPIPAEVSPAAGEAPVAEPALPQVDFRAVATLCGDLARIADMRSLSPVLEQASAVLDAAGVVVWIADPDGRELAPILTHGYPAHLVTRLGTIKRDAENATAAAFRTGLLQTVHADAVSNGAVAVPLVTQAGCVGVMAAEIRHEGEQQPPRLAAAAILAAQLATLVGPPVVRKAEAANA
jgi:CHASE3 domain sensor protein